MRALLVVLFLLAGLPAVAADYKRTPGPFAVDTLTGSWTDRERARQIPFKIYYAPQAEGARPIVLFSHGLGGNREGGAYLGQHLASWGYAAVHLQHPGSDEALWKDAENPREALRAWARNPRAMLESADQRFRDLPVAIDALAIMAEADPQLAGRLDLSRIGMSGHSFGAHSTLAAAGQNLGRRGQTRSYAEPRIRAAIAYSPSPPRQREDYDLVYRDIRVPIFHMTGTADGDPLGRGFEAADRQTPFRRISTTDQFLLVLEGGDHMIFNGRTRGRAKPGDARHLDLIRMGSIAFWDAYLLGDAEAFAWLAGGGFAAEVGSEGKFEQKIRPGN